MARSDPFDGLAVFLAIARQGGFRAAAASLGVTPGAVSQALRGLEARLGTPLFHRTTRSVSLTEAGTRLLAGAAPAADGLTEVLDDLRQSGDHPSGTLRLLAQRATLTPVLDVVLPAYLAAYPEVRVEVRVGPTPRGFVAEGFDAALGIGEFFDQDMIAVRVSRPFDWVVAAAPDYLDRHGRPERPEDLAHHSAINFRRATNGELYRWEFQRDGQALTVLPGGRLVVDDAALARSLACRGLGLIYSFDLALADDLAQGRLVPVLQDFAPARDSMVACFPRASRGQPKLRAFVDTCRRVLSLSGEGPKRRKAGETSPGR